VKKLILMTKRVFLKAPYQVQSFKQHLPDAFLPPPPEKIPLLKYALVASVVQKDPFQPTTTFYQIKENH
jgi:hypothetical protein